MFRLARSPPVVGLALALGFGATLHHLGAPSPWTPLTLLAVPLLIPPSRRPEIPVAAHALALLAGFSLAHGWQRRIESDCRFHLEEGRALRVSGRLAGPLVDGRGELNVRTLHREGCGGIFRLVVPGSSEGGSGAVATSGSEAGTSLGFGAGTPVTVSGRWRKSRTPELTPPLRAGYLRVDSLYRVEPPSGPDPRDALVAVGGWVQTRLEELFPRTAGVVTALVWARKDGLPYSLRDSFARAGTAHLLAISGFHVGVVAGLLLYLLGSLGLPHSTRAFLAGVGVWAYVVAIGAPDAAMRAALLLSLLALGRMRNRPLAPLGVLATAFLGFVVLDPGALLRTGFQLSFSGALGLGVGYRPVTIWVSRLSNGQLPSYLCQGIAAGVSATLATLPLVAWHFGRVSLIGIPMTLLATPLVALAIPGIFATLILSLAHPGLALFLATGVESALELLLKLVHLGAALPFASIWVSHTTVLAACGALLCSALLRSSRSVPGGVRRRPFLAWSVIAGILLGPPSARILTLGVLELVVLDVGQGDAALLRSPGGRWILVDAGPRTETFDAGERTVLPYLRKRGVQALDLMVLTHPDMDHVGGASSVLQEFRVRSVLDPGRAAGTQVFIDALRAAQETGIPWRVAEAGDSLNLDGMALRVLAPEEGDQSPAREGSNGASLVLEVRYGAFSAVLAGDAPATSEERFIPRIFASEIQVLKVGHHGSSTSTTRELLARTSPEIALISVGRRNRFGHPDKVVLDRLEKGGARVLRTDLSGNLVVRARRDGSYRVSVQHR